MERIWQWAWDRYSARYSWAVYAILSLLGLQIYLLSSFLIVAYEESDRYIAAAVVSVVAVLVQVYVVFLPGVGRIRLAEQWAARKEVDRARALDATYTWARRVVARGVGGNGVSAALLSVIVGAIAGATGSRLVQYAILGVVIGIGPHLIAMHSFMEAALRPVRIAIAGDTGIGDSLPRSRPTFAAWSDVSILATAFTYAVAGAMLAAVFDWTREVPVLVVVIGCALTLGFAVPMTVGVAFSPSLRPIRDLADGTERVAAGDYSQRLPVVQDDDLGALADVVQPHAGGFG